MSANAFPVKTSRSFGRITQNAGTAITRLIPPVAGAITHIAYVSYNNGATAHTLYAMRVLGQTTITTAVASGGSSFVLTADPGKYSTTYSGGTSSVSDDTIAASDYIAYQCADGTFVLDTVSTWTAGTLTMVTTGTAPAAGVLAGAPLWYFGISTDTNPSDNAVHPFFNLPASTITTLGGSSGEASGGGIVSSIPHPVFFTPPSGVLGWNGAPAAGATTMNGGINQNGYGEPILLYDANATNAGNLEQVVAFYSDR